jgi:ketosteroid isomerase-like protein
MSDIPSTGAYFQALNSKDQEAFVDCFTPDCEVHNPFGSPAYMGSGALPSLFKALTDPWDKLLVIPKAAYRSGKRVAVLWMAEGQGLGGQKTDFEGVNVFELADDGRIARLEAYWDSRATQKELDQD